MTTRLMALSRLARQVSRSRMTLSVAPRMAMASFSSEAALIPGVGKGKTSTGLDMDYHIQEICTTTRTFTTTTTTSPTDLQLLKQFRIKNQKLVDLCSQIPPKTPKRINVETVARYRLDIEKECNGNISQLEKQCGSVSLSELVQQAEKELIIVQKFMNDMKFDTPK